MEFCQSGNVGTLTGICALLSFVKTEFVLA